MEILKSQKKIISKDNLKCILNYFLSYKKNFLILFIISTLKTVCQYISPLINMLIIDDGIGKKNITILIASVFLLLLISGIGECLDIWQTSFNFKFSYIMEKDLKNKILDKTLNSNFNYSSGEVDTLIKSDANTFISTITSGIQTIVSNCISLVLGAVILIKLQWDLAIIILIMQIGIVFFQLNKNKKLEEQSIETRGKHINLITVLNEIILNIKKLANLGASKYIKNKFNVSLDESYKEEKNILILQTIISSIVSFLNVIMLCTILLYGGYKIICGNMTIGKLITFTQYINSFSAPLIAIISVPMDFSCNFASLSSILEILKDNKFTSKKRYISNISKISLKNLNFSYEEKNQLFKDANAEFKINEINYIIGESGIGKSTLIKLLLKRIQTEKNYIWFDDVELNSIDNESIIALISWVSQDTVIFYDTIYNNITLGEKIDINKIKEVCEACMIWDDINKLEDGLNTIIYEHGDNLSGGQKNRVCLARALLLNKQVLIIDEGTAGLDIVTENAVKMNLKKYFKDKIVIIITHSKNFILDDSKQFIIKDKKILLNE